MTSDQATPPGDVSAVVTCALTRSMKVSTRCDTPEAPRSDQTLITDTPSLQSLNDDVSPCILEDNSDHGRPSMKSLLVQSSCTDGVSDESETRTISSDVPNVVSIEHSDSDVSAAESASDCELDTNNEDQNTAVKIPRGTCLMCAFWGQGAGKCKEHG